MARDELYPNIWVTQCEQLWTPDQLRANGFTHIVRIDSRRQRYVWPPALPGNVERLNGDACCGLDRWELDFECGVIRNAYGAVEFIERAFRRRGRVLFVDDGSRQKSGAMVVAYLMYRDHIKFKTAYRMVTEHCPDLQLQPYYCQQLIEYEPILQVQRDQRWGSCCSRDQRCTLMKRKYINESRDSDDDGDDDSINNSNNNAVDSRWSDILVADATSSSATSSAASASTTASSIAASSTSSASFASSSTSSATSSGSSSSSSSLPPLAFDDDDNGEEMPTFADSQPPFGAVDDVNMDGA